MVMSRRERERERRGGRDGGRMDVKFMERERDESIWALTGGDAERGGGGERGREAIKNEEEEKDIRMKPNIKTVRKKQIKRSWK